MTISNEPLSSQSDKSLQELITFLRNHSMRIFLAGVIGGVIGASLFLTLPKRWEATALFQVGQINFSSKNAPVSIEPVPQVVERVKTTAFADDVFQQMFGDSNAAASEAALLRNTLTAKALPGTSVVQISAQGHSPKIASDSVTMTMRLLASGHSRTVATAETAFKEQLSEVIKELSLRNQVTTALRSHLATTTTSSASSTARNDSLLLTSLALADSRTEELVKLKFDLQEQLSPLRTFPSKPLQQTVVSREPVFPKASLFIGGGALLGLFLAVLWALSRETPKFLRTQSQ
ncbi:hypothetical protein [Ralstonia holmesii]|uniref:hypothetical protein n=1 Tax=Ralstonia holmesii TaxID=3058602 RepID=UPI0028F67631|nr:hypothetical protein [Ralstonia sp. LMG 32967]CAJ0701829.1 hypothetical protein R11007_03656 [Ralstonia sp. LMG 32967]